MFVSIYCREIHQDDCNACDFVILLDLQKTYKEKIIKFMLLMPYLKDKLQ